MSKEDKPESVREVKVEVASEHKFSMREKKYFGLAFLAIFISVFGFFVWDATKIAPEFSHRIPKLYLIGIAISSSLACLRVFFAAIYRKAWAPDFMTYPSEWGKLRRRVHFLTLGLSRYELP